MLAEWQKHKTQLRSYVAKRIDDVDAVDDILQDVYIKASINLHQLKSAGSLKGWLYRIAHNTLMDFYRTRQHFDELPDNLVAQEQDSGAEARAELAECLRPLIDELPEKYSIPLRLAELEGMPQQQIADQLGLSLSGAKSRVQRSRVKFREQLMACCDFEINEHGISGYSVKDPKRSCR
ncbi:RNA polymerase sigma factor SigZ [Shewanella inventionis]|uniref:RNA polymerase sigma factor SigZ n=1 Tax=Shewanella inventionis TaxID=1738770 RepID=A0ABQ1IKN4_9GAMM|nr:RNA polymerase sigma factor SigZ [Shewanella inventionis]MCL1156453.1 RNA polymerase sigma factor SigZ [Shewanella inventionis]UAL43474.1 RNA polymerase sigma factor SigZ [Shewanella inventionis]GGB45629.1 RNA polymerase sigma factor SigZ [Shewanella inventionis]